ncbi:MAG: prolipoprotein diacylglyceryl transferase [Planctomycetota bacterium]
MHPELFRIPIGAHGIPVTSYGAMLVCAFFLTTWLAMWIGPKIGFKAVDISDYVFIAMISGLIGARLLIGIEEPTPMFYPRYVGGGLPPDGQDNMPAKWRISTKDSDNIFKRRFEMTAPGTGAEKAAAMDYIGTDRLLFDKHEIQEERARMADLVKNSAGLPDHDSFLRQLYQYDAELDRLNGLQTWYDQNKSEFLQPFEVFKIWQGGLTFYGGAIAGVLMTILFTRWRRIPLNDFWDFCSPWLALGLAVGRVGCFLNGCCQGSYTDFLSVKFPSTAVAINDFTEQTYHAACNLVPLHPAQLYGVLGNFLLAAYLFTLYPYRKYPGQVAVHCMALYIPMRIALEMIRCEPPLFPDLPWHFLASLTPSMWVGLVMIPLPIFWWRRWSNRFKGQPGAQAHATAMA